MTRMISFLSFKAMYQFQHPVKYILFRILDPLLYYLFFAGIGLSILGVDYLEFIIVGNIFFIIARTIFMNLINLFRYERMFGTLVLNLASPMSTMRLMMTRSVIPVLDGLIVAVVSFALAAWLFKFDIEWSMIPSLFVLGLAIIFSLLALSLILAGVGMLLNNVNLWLNLWLGAFQLFCGVNYPVHLLPYGLDKAALLLPITNGLMGVREVMNGASLGDVSHYVWVEILVGVCYLIVALFAIKWFERWAFKKGTLFLEE